MFSESKGHPIMVPFDDPMVIELKVASALQIKGRDVTLPAIDRV